MKKFFFPRVIVFLGGALLVGLPVSVLLPGCGGGGGSSSPSIKLFSAPVQLSATQSAVLNVRLRGEGISGTLVVQGPITQAAKRQTAAIPFTVPAGTYALTGTFTPPRGFTLVGDFPGEAGAFTVTGQIPSSSDDGTYTLTAGGQTVSGTFKTGNSTPIPTTTATVTGTPSTTASPTTTPSSTSGPTPTVTTVPTSTPVATRTPSPTTSPTTRPTTVPIATGLKLTYSQNNNANNVPTSASIPLTTGSANISAGTLSATFRQADNTPEPLRQFTLELSGQGAITAGKSYALGNLSEANYYELTRNVSNERRWEATAGTVRILSVVQGDGSATVQISIVGARMKAALDTKTSGTFQFDGTAKFVVDTNSTN